MTSTPFMPLWVGDFLLKTSDLDARETGAYLLLLMAMWTRDGYLPADQKKLQRVAKCGREWPAVWAAIGHYFTEVDGRLTQGRLQEELAKVRAKVEVNQHNGRLGGRAKALKTKDAPVANASVSPEQLEPYTETKDTEAKASDASVDFAKDVWERGIAFLGRHGTPDRPARAIIGKWRKAYQDTDIYEAFMACSKQGVINPIPWITARLKGKDKANGKSDKQQRKLDAFIAGSTGAPPMDCGPDLYSSQPLLARG